MKTRATMATGVLLLLAGLSLESAGAWSAPSGSASGAALVWRAPSSTLTPEGSTAVDEQAGEPTVAVEDPASGTPGDIDISDEPAGTSPAKPVNAAIEPRPNVPVSKPGSEGDTARLPSKDYIVDPWR